MTKATERFHIPIDVLDRLANRWGAAIPREWFNGAREVFETFAGLDAPDLPGTPDNTQVQLARWQVRNFGVVRSVDVALGVIEELGELRTADVMSDHLDDDEQVAGMRDAIGDVMVYAAQLATSERLSLHAIYRAASEGAMRIPDTANDALVAAGLLSHFVLKGAQGIRGLDQPEPRRLAAYLGLLLIVSHLHRGGYVSEDPWAIYQVVAAKVQTRDWTVAPVTAGDEATAP